MQGLENTSNQPFRDIVGNGVRLEVPRFQRDYSWEQHHWADLWDDILQAKETNDWHYLGFIVLQRRGDNYFAVIDGQQRITTLSLLILAAMRVIRKLGGSDADRRVDVLRSSYIGRQDAVTLLTSNKLSLNRNNDQLYKTYLTELRDAPATGLKASERALVSALKFFETKLNSYPNGESIARLIEFVAGRFSFTLIQVTSELNAYRVFETLNARGVQLSAADLLKNYLFATVDYAKPHDNELEELELQWARIIGSLGRDSLQHFLRAYWNSRYAQVRAPRLYPAVREQVSDPKDVFTLLRELDEAAPVYAALRDPGHELWNDLPEARRHLATLKTLLVRQYVPLLLSGYQSLERQSFLRLLRDTVAFSLRYNTVGGQGSGPQEALYGQVARRIRASGHYAVDALEPLYPSDGVFVAALREWSASSSPQGVKIAMYILRELERQHGSKSILSGTERVTLEHILPQHPAEKWHAPDDPVWARAPWRLGNLTLLEEKLNRKAGQLPISEKTKLYQQSDFSLTREINTYCEGGTWTERSIDRRQASLAKLATAVWQLSS